MNQKLIRTIYDLSKRAEEDKAGVISPDRLRIDMNETRKRVERVTDFALVYASAYAYMVEHPRAHPISALVFAVENEAPNLIGGAVTDKEFFELTVGWRVLCASSDELRSNKIYQPKL